MAEKRKVAEKPSGRHEAGEGKRIEWDPSAERKRKKGRREGRVRKRGEQGGAKGTTGREKGRQRERKSGKAPAM